MIKSILFDFDGTLLDSYSAHFECFKGMFSRLGYVITEELYLSTYSPNWYQTYQAMGLPEDQWEEANNIWMEEATRHEPVLFPGVELVLSRLEPHFFLGLVTSGSKSRVKRDLERTGIDSCFRMLVTGDDVQRAKPAPEGLEIAMRELKVTPDQTTYVGDALADFQMAQAACVNFIGIPSQFASLKPETPCIQVKNIIELLDIFKPS